MADYIEYIQLGVGSEAIPIRDPNAAPKGYGLGGMCASIDSVLNISANGWYLTNVDTPSENAWYLCIARCTNDGGDIIVDAWRYGGTYHAIRTKSNGTWNDWEWDTHPMTTGNEYRTTERWRGKAVYAKVIALGSLPNAATTSVSHGVSATNILRYVATLSDGKALPYCYSNTRVDVGVSSTSVHITAATDFSDKTAVVVLYYTKD